ncbi:hypothetical protein [Nocardioides sp.]|uniref:hypothetical protein n=1 Tax=Nocardioides sp. TaxID=35761 RepID=UPI0035139EBC
MFRRRLAVPAVIASLLASGCAPQQQDAAEPADVRPTRFTIAPDDYHVPYAGTAEDGRRFFLTDELFDPSSEPTTGFVGLFLWNADGTFDEVRVDPVAKGDGPPGQAVSAAAGDLVERRLRELGDYTLEPITVEPFTTVVDGATFGWEVGRYDEADGGGYYIGIRPGDFIVYYAPWDGLDYDT